MSNIGDLVVGTVAYLGNSSGCPDCARLRRENDELRRRVAEMEKRVILARSQPEGLEGRIR